MLARAPWTPNKKAKTSTQHKLAKARRDHLVDVIIVVLKAGRSSKFEFEAACRHGLRSGLCLEGWPWSSADAVAANITERALNLIGAKRPTWLQGQPEWADTAPSTRTTWEWMYCARCGRPLPEHNVGRFYGRFCSRLCKYRTHSEKYQRDHRAEIAARARIRRAANPEYHREVVRRFWQRQPEQTCEKCGRLYQPKRRKQRFCGLKCRPPVRRGSSSTSVAAE